MTQIVRATATIVNMQPKYANISSRADTMQSLCKPRKNAIYAIQMYYTNREYIRGAVETPYERHTKAF